MPARVQPIWQVQGADTGEENLQAELAAH